MIKLFRNIRKQLLNQGKTTNYLKYAVGEIVLVVIGILIALQINNWNQNRNNTAEELKILKSCKTGLEIDLEDIDHNIKRHKNSIASTDLILQMLKDNKKYDDSVAYHFSKIMLPTFFVHSTSAFETLKAKGIDIVSNEILRNKIIQVYDNGYTFFLEFEKDHNNQYTWGLNTIFNTRFEDSFYYDVSSASLSGKIIPLNFDSLKNDQEFLYYLKSLRNRNIVFINFQYKKLRILVVELIALLDKEIKKIEAS
ncbi:MAG: hypothetical protein GW839_09345 [Flavobacteriales bacterium]|nr:hypothetical protein [Flavobacteriia bacterium]NCP06708.1 hypothetical protein [Flavobacteriales bacterium]PIV92773.1 MAG: hypothetical protein COW44_13035 [Flavobacteriaceae bacterium CG17_big_fil_post_rev_8_21_14_2_50_33_15]PIY11244.1 MAG: hypothetical protein COZ17_07360 [Flavobacteriaceae bacterium CG_4_10_14_3_um_filter_33_47]PJB18513.1 MAG: hypothetical protein CO117_07915 [Flavobacteriaceae bacterium CG_4_9_14_3_um_filter_33_16]